MISENDHGATVISASNATVIGRDALLFAVAGVLLLVSSTFLLSLQGGGTVGLIVGLCSVTSLFSAAAFALHYSRACRDSTYSAITIGRHGLTLKQLGTSVTLGWQQIESAARVEEHIHSNIPTIGIRFKEANLPFPTAWKANRDEFGCDALLRLTSMWSRDDLREIDEHLLSRYPNGISKMVKSEITELREGRLRSILQLARQTQAALLILAIPFFIFLTAAIQSPTIGAIYSRLLRGPERLVSDRVHRIVLADLHGEEPELLEKAETEMEHLLSSEVEITATPLPEAVFPRGQKIDASRLRKYLAAELKPTSEERVFGISSLPLTHTSKGSGFLSADPASPTGAVSIHGVKDGASGQPGLAVNRTVKLLLNALGTSMGFHPEISRGCVMGLTRTLVDLDERGERYCGKHVDHLHFLGMLH